MSATETIAEPEKQEKNTEPPSFNEDSFQQNEFDKQVLANCPPWDGFYRVTRRQASVCRKEGFKDLICVIMPEKIGNHSRLFVSNSGAFVESPMAAWPFVIASATRSYTSMATVFYVPEQYKATTKVPKKQIRKCRIEEMVGGSTVTMLCHAPLNRSVRTRVESIIGEQLPAELTSYGQIKDWIEYNFPKKNNSAEEAHEQLGVFTCSADRYYTAEATCEFKKSFRGNVVLLRYHLQVAANMARQYAEQHKLTPADMKSHFNRILKDIAITMARGHQTTSLTNYTVHTPPEKFSIIDNIDSANVLDVRAMKAALADVCPDMM